MSTPMQRALLSLDGLSLGDSLGERFFGPPADAVSRILAHKLPPAPWRYTDDTEMAISVVETLAAHGGLDPDDLARRFARRYDVNRGYGGAMHGLLQDLRQGAHWAVAASRLFDGAGSFGNGSAMRVAPLGAYLADDLGQVAPQAARSARVTHAHPEGVAGAVAVALAAALAWQQAEAGRLDGASLLARVIEDTPESETRNRLRQAVELPTSTDTPTAARLLGSGQDVSAQDTVPYALLCASRHLDDLEAAFWDTVIGLGDRDTTCAICCGVVACSARRVPEVWVRCREPLALEV